jgi:hypothetical protein
MIEPEAVSVPIAPSATLERPARNRLGLAGLILVVIAVFVPVIAFAVVSVIAVTEGPQTADGAGWGVLAGVFSGGLGFGLAGPIALVGTVLGIVSLFRAGQGKALGIVAIVLGAPLAVVGLIVLPFAFSLVFGTPA